MKRFTLDSRELEHPKPLEMAISLLRELDDDSYLYMLNKRNPVPLINLAQKQNFQVLYHGVDESNWHILITPNKKISLEEYLDV